MKFLNSNLLVGLLSTVILVALVSWGLSWQVERVEIPPPAPNRPAVVSRSIDLTGRQQGQQRWRLLAEQVQMDAGKQVFNQGAHGFFYGNPDPNQATDPFFKDAKEMTWQAGQASYEAAKDQLLLNQNVQVQGTDGSQLITETLKISPQAEIEIPARFTIKNPDIALTGSSGSFNFQFALMSAQQGQLTVLPDKAAAATDTTSTVIKAEKLQYNRNTQVAQGQGNLTIQQGGVEIRAPQGTYSRVAGQSTLSGGVTLRDPDAGRRGGSVVPDLTVGQPQSNARQDVTILADNLSYNRNSEVAQGQGNLVIQQGGVEIRAPQGIYDRRQAQSALTGGVVLTDPTAGDTILADATLAQAPAEASPPQEVTIVADKLTYDRNTQVAQGEGNLKISQGDTVIDAPQGSYRRRESQSILTGGVTLTEPKRILKSQRLTGNHKDKIFLFEENVVYTQQASGSPPTDPSKPAISSELQQSETEVKAAKLVYNSRTTVSEFSEDVQFTQKGRQAKAQQLKITPEMVTLNGSVEIQQIQGDWLAKRVKDPDAQANVDRPTLIFADRVEIDQKTSDARFFDNVVIVQANRAAEGDKATYSDGKQMFELASTSKPVMLCDRGDAGKTVAKSVQGLPGRDALDVTCRGANQIRSKLITLDMAKDTFSASGQSSMQFRVTSDQ